VAALAPSLLQEEAQEEQSKSENSIDS